MILFPNTSERERSVQESARISSQAEEKENEIFTVNATAYLGRAIRGNLLISQKVFVNGSSLCLALIAIYLLVLSECQ
jgi:hypothetical protein